MEELFIIRREGDGLELWYHSLTPRGKAIWVDEDTEAQALTYGEACKIKEFIYSPETLYIERI